MFYVTGSAGKYTLMAAPVKTALSGVTPVFETDAPKPLFDVRTNSYEPSLGTFFYSVSKDGARFLINHVDSTSEPILNVIVNWEQAFLRGN